MPYLLRESNFVEYFARQCAAGFTPKEELDGIYELFTAFDLRYIALAKLESCSQLHLGRPRLLARLSKHLAKLFMTWVPEDFLKAYYLAVSADVGKAVSMNDSQTTPNQDAVGFVQGMVQGDQTLYLSHSGIESINDVKMWPAKRDAKYTGFSLTLQFSDGKTTNGRGYLIQENSQWRMTNATNQRLRN